MDLKTFLPVHCIEDIFCHLTGLELLKCTLVCPTWNNYIGSTSTCMEKIKLKCSGIDSLEHIERILVDSQRKYTKLKLNAKDSEEFCERMQNAMPLNSRPWTHIFATRLKFTSINQFHDFLMIFEPTVEKLIFNSNIEPADRYDEPDLQFPALQFPSLKTLRIDRYGHTFANHYEKIFVDCKKLEHLTFWLHTMPDPALNAIRTTLKMNENLKTLELLHIHDGNVFSEDFSSEIKFKLESFCIYFNVLEPQLLRNLHSFLITQKNCLEKLTIRITTIETMKIIASMPRLKKLYLHGIDDIDQLEVAAESWPPNHSLTVLNIPCFWNDNNSYEFFPKLFPKVEALHITTFGDREADFISENFKCLKRMRMENFRATSIKDEDFFLRLSKLCRLDLVATEYEDLSKKLNVQKVQFEFTEEPQTRVDDF